MGLGLTNPMTAVGSAQIELNNQRVNLAGRSLSSGLKGDRNNVVNLYVGNNLNDQASLLRTVKGNALFTNNMLMTAERNLDQMSNTLTDISEVVSQATGASGSTLKTLNNILQQKLSQFALQRDSGAFAGIKLFDGNLGADASVKAAFDTKAVSVKRLNHGTILEAQGTKAVDTLTIAALTEGDFVQLGGVKFTATSGDPEPGKDQFKIAATPQETARNLVSAIVNSDMEGPKKYSVNVNGADVVVSQIAASEDLIPLAHGANVTLAHTTVGTKGGVDLSNITNMEKFIGAPKMKFEVISRVQSAGGNGAAKILATSFGNAQAIDANAADGNIAASLKATDADGRIYYGSIFTAAGDMNDRTIVMTSESTSESFTINTKSAGFANGGDLSTDANAATFANTLSNIFSDSSFNQTRVLEIDTSKGDVFNTDTGAKVASMNGLTVSLTSTDFINKQFTGFKIESEGGDVRLTASIEGNNGNKQEFTVKVASGDIANLVQGTKLDLKDDVTGDLLSFNLGEGGLTSLSSVTNHSSVAKAYSDALLKVNYGQDFRTGTGTDDVMTVKVGSMLDEKVFQDRSGNYISDLNILDENAARIALEVVGLALDKVRTEQSAVKAQREIVEGVSRSLQTLIDTTQESADSYLNADMVQAAKEFSESLKKVLAAISVIQAGVKMSDGAEQLLQRL